MVAPYRPMFLAGAIWAMVGVVLAGWDTRIDLTLSPFGDRWAWHGHEMVFGFAAAMFAGYVLTAMPSWTGGARMSRPDVALLLALWFVARLTAMGAFGTNPAVVIAGTAAFLGFVALTLARGALRSPSAKSTGLALFALAMTGVQIAVLFEGTARFIPVMGFAILLSLVGGRMVAAFTWNRLSHTAPFERRFKAARRCGYVSVLAMMVALLLESFGTASDWLFASLLVAAVAELGRLSLWVSRDSFRDGLLGMLSLAYAWLPLGLLLVAFSKSSDWILPESDAWHALTTGALACSFYAVASRPVARRDRHLRPALADLIGFVLLWITAAWRVFFPVESIGYATVSLIWCIVWVIFFVRHGLALFRPVSRPAFSGPKQRTSRETTGDSP